MPTPMGTVRAIVRALRELRRTGQQAEAIVLSPELYGELRARAFQYLWTSPEQNDLLETPIAVDPHVKGWSIRARVREQTVSQDLQPQRPRSRRSR